MEEENVEELEDDLIDSVPLSLHECTGPCPSFHLFASPQTARLRHRRGMIIPWIQGFSSVGSQTPLAGAGFWDGRVLFSLRDVCATHILRAGVSHPPGIVRDRRF